MSEKLTRSEAELRRLLAGARVRDQEARLIVERWRRMAVAVGIEPGRDYAELGFAWARGQRSKNPRVPTAAEPISARQAPE